VLERFWGHDERGTYPAGQSFEDQFVVHLEQQGGAWCPVAASAASMRTMASLMRSAAVPCRGEFTAVRSAKPRALELRLLISGMGRSSPPGGKCLAPMLR
jgi:hypothetical protein